MQRIVEVRVRALVYNLQPFPRRIRCRSTPRNEHFPVQETGDSRPRAKRRFRLRPCGFPGPAHEAHDHCPIRVPIHARDQELRLRIRKAGELFLTAHETAVCLRFQARCASSKIATCSFGGPRSISASSRKWCTFWMNAFTLSPTVPLRTFSPVASDARPHLALRLPEAPRPRARFRTEKRRVLVHPRHAASLNSNQPKV